MAKRGTFREVLTFAIQNFDELYPDIDAKSEQAWFSLYPEHRRQDALSLLGSLACTERIVSGEVPTKDELLKALVNYASQ